MPPSTFPLIFGSTSPGIISLLQNIKEDIIQKVDIKQEDLHTHKIGCSLRKPLMVITFAMTDPKQFKRP